MAAYLIAPRDQASYLHDYEHGNHVSRLARLPDLGPYSIRDAIRTFAGQYGVVDKDLTCVLNESVRSGFIGEVIRRPARQWMLDDIEVMLDLHDFPDRRASLDPHLNNIIILNGLARLYGESDLTLEIFLCSWAVAKDCFPVAPWRSQADYRPLLLPSIDPPTPLPGPTEDDDTENEDGQTVQWFSARENATDDEDAEDEEVERLLLCGSKAAKRGKTTPINPARYIEQ